MERRITLARRATAEIEEKKSVFIANVAPVTSREEAEAFVQAIKKEYHDARHNVFAYYIDNGAVQRYSDDGEPQGSSGIPALNVLKMSGATDICAVITRYFGGILLGTGGLARAYSSAVKAALDEAGFAAFEQFSVYEIHCSYSDYTKLTSKLPAIGAVEDKSEFAGDVTVFAAILSKDAAELKKLVTEVTSGRSSAIFKVAEERPVKL